MGDNHERTSDVTNSRWFSFEVHRIVAGKQAKRQGEIAGELTDEKKFP